MWRVTYWAGRQEFVFARPGYGCVRTRKQGWTWDTALEFVNYLNSRGQ